MVIRGVVFDLDDTLFLEQDYVRSGFEHVGRIAADAGLDGDVISDWLWKQFEDGIRGTTFDRLLVAFPALADQMTTVDLVMAYRSHAPHISLLSGASDVIAELRGDGVRLGILSDGPIQSQQAKAMCLGLAEWFDPIVLTAARAGFAKPATAGFEGIAVTWELPPNQLAYVADNPRKDFAGPRQLGWRTVRVRQIGQITYPLEAPDDDQAPEFEAGDLAAAARYLRGSRPA